MMRKLRIFIGNGLAGFLDLAVGALIASATLSYFGTQPQLWHLAVGAVLAILPDFDIVPAILSGREAKGNHRVSLMHRPLLVIPAATLVAYTLGGDAWWVVAFLCVTWHYLHDTPPLSLGGIAWLWPFDERYWSPWGPKVAVDDSGLTHYAWLERFWLRPSALSVTEVGIGTVALATALLIALR
jgi:membrane-bound metal-dependent hydrolase YbcI (DUF457 family)